MDNFNGNEFDNATPEQRKEISKILFKGRTSLLFSALKFMVGLFASNMISIFVGAKILADVDPEIQLGFQFVSMLLNAIFMSLYFNSNVKENSTKVMEKIKEVLKK